MALTCGGMTDSSWMESIWPSLSAAPRMRQSATASRSAFASVMNTESPGRMDSTAVEVSPSAPGALPLPLHARLADSEMVPAARPAASEPKPMTRWIGDDGTATARRSVDGGLLGVTRGGAVDAEAEDARLSPSVVVVASGAAFGLDAGAGVGLGPGALNGVAVGFSASDDAVPGAVRARWAAAAAATGAASRVFPPLMSKSAAARSGPREPRPSTPLSAAPVRATPRTVLARRATTLARSDILSIQSRERSRGRRNVVPIEESTWPKQMKTTGWEQKLVSPVSGQYNGAVADPH